MPGPNTGSNRFGPSSYCVGPTLGNGVNFTDIQAAITQAVADGFDTTNPTTILVRPGTYSSFTLAPGILVEGVCAGSVFSNYASVIGNVTIDSTTVGGILYSMKNLNISDPVDAVIIQGVGSPIFVDIANCSINGSRGIVIGNTSGTFSQIALRECRIVASVIAVDLQQHNILVSEQSTYSAPDCIVLSGNARVNMIDCVIDGTATYGFEITGTGNRVNLNFCNVTSIEEAIIGPNAGESINVNHCTFNSSAASGFFIDGVDTFEFYDLALTGTALVNNAIATNFIDWQPHAGTAASATLPGGVRGTACFDSGAFSVTDGFVQLIGGGVAVTSMPTDSGTAAPNVLGQIAIVGGPGVTTEATGPSTIQVNSVTFADVGGVTTVAANSGSFCSNVGLSAITLPAAPQEGDLCEFAISNGLGFIVTANAGQTLRLGTATGTTATSTAFGDALILRFRASISEWHAMSIVGNWVVA